MEVKTEKSYWRTGKEQYREFCEIKLKKGTTAKSIFLGLILTAILVIPFAIFVFQFVDLYWFNTPNIMYLFLGIAFALFMVCNGLSNYISVKAVKLLEKDMDNLQNIDEKAVFYYQFLNPWFALFILVILIYFAVSSGVI